MTNCSFQSERLVSAGVLSFCCCGREKACLLACEFTNLVFVSSWVCGLAVCRVCGGGVSFGRARSLKKEEASKGPVMMFCVGDSMGHKSQS
jgi:hypothetical protein